MHPSLRHLDHRPWPLPAARWFFRQRWTELLFAHWPVPVATVRPLVPADLEIDTFDGVTYVGVVPFLMTRIFPRGVPAWMPDVRGLTAFPELNVRLYVRHRNRPGVFFLSLDASSGVGVWTARRFFNLPYFHAAMSVGKRDDVVSYRSTRRVAARWHDVPLHDFPDASPVPEQDVTATYRPTGDVFFAKPGTLDHFLAERYGLFTHDRAGRLLRGDIHHPPWPLQAAEGTVEIASPLVSGPPSLLRYSPSIDVALWRFSVVE